jgi:cytoskeleton protein RodZ
MTKEKATQKDFLELRTKREALGLTLKDINSITRVSIVNLEAIENGEFHDLPVPVYTKNFIKNYAGALKMDSKPILDSYEAYLNSLQIAKTQIPETVSGTEPLIKKPLPYKKYVMAAVIIIIVAVGTFIIFQQKQPVPEVTGNQPEIIATAPQPSVNTTTPVTPPEQTNAVVQPVPAETTKQTPPQPAPPQQKSAAQLESSPKQNAPGVEKTEQAMIREEADVLVIRATEETWLRIKIDQNPSFQILLKPGEAIERKGAGFDIDIGNAGGIKMQFKGKSIESLGKSGQVIHLRLP